MSNENEATDELTRAGVICNAPRLKFSSETPKKGKTEMPERTPTENVEYELVAWEPDGSLRNAIAMSRDEFIAINEHLIAMRGYRKEQELDRLTKEEIAGYEETQHAGFIETARDFYRAFPSLVVAEKTPPMLQKMLEKEKARAA